uniref:Cellulose synthase 3 n=1 Tax=Saprolegnia monoica TaxID=37553 RepID=C9WPK0_SAPMO|nr:cellulose synthase 3 [Saprolegnia monoica]
MVDLGLLVSGIVGVAGGFSAALAGWSPMSIGARPIFVLTQGISVFAIVFMAIYSALQYVSLTAEGTALGVAAGVGAGCGVVAAFATVISPLFLTAATGLIIAPYLLVLDKSVGNLFTAESSFAKQEFVVGFGILFFVVFMSNSKTSDTECHRFKYILFSAITGGWLFSDGLFRLAFTDQAPLSKVMYGIMGKTYRGSSYDLSNISNSNVTNMYIIWVGVGLVGAMNQLSMRWGLLCYNKVGAHVGMTSIHEDTMDLPSGAAASAPFMHERTRLVCENCFATVPAGTAFCTECGEAMPTDDHEPTVSISQAQMPSIAMGVDGKTPERWQQIPNRAYLSTTSYVDPKKMTENNTESRSIRFMDAGDKPYGASMTGRPNHYEPSFRSFAMSTYSIANRAAEPVETPNIRKYKMSGGSAFHLIYFLSAATGIVWLAFLITFYPRETPCAVSQPQLACNLIESTVVTANACYSSSNPTNINIQTQEPNCIKKTPGGVWFCYCIFVGSEYLNFFLGLLYNFSMWRPIRRGARYLNDFKPALPKEQWPTVDVFLCHYSEPVVDSMKTIKNILAMQYPPELLHVWICDDGYTRSVWDANNHFKVTVNTKNIEMCGDIRGDVARMMHERVVGPVQDDASLKAWRRQHSSVRELKKDGAKGVQRRDCAVGSLSDDYDYRDRGLPRVTFVGRMKPEEHHAKAGNINNVLFNEGADGKYILILDNDMKPHPKFLLAVLPFFFSEGEAVDGGGRQYSDDISWNQVAYVQTPQYFEDTPQITEMGDPCGHKNTIFFDAVQCGRDGFDSAAFAGTNAVFRRQAFDSIGGIQYGTQTEDAFTGNILHGAGWDSIYFRKDFEGEPKDRIRLCEGAIPETVAASLGQKKRWAMGAVQILLMKGDSEVDPDWRPPRVPAPDPKPSLVFPRKIFFYDSVFYPFGSIPALCYVFIAIYYLITGSAPIYTPGQNLLYTFLPLMLVRWMLSLLANRTVDSNDVWRAQQTWFSYSFITALAIGEAVRWRLTGVISAWANTGAGQKTSWTEIPNVLMYFTLVVSQFVGLTRFFEYENATSPWNYISAMFFGFWIMSNLYPMAKMSISEYAGWDHTTATFTANIFGSLLLVGVVVFVQVWQSTYSTNSLTAQGLSTSSTTSTSTTTTSS